MKFLKAVQMRRLELNSEALGVSGFLLMENAGRRIAEEVVKRFRGNVAILTGSGGKAGDGYATARHLSSFGYKVTVRWVADPELNDNPHARSHWQILRNLNSVVIERFEDKELNEDIIIDGLLGTGFKGRVRQPYLDAIQKINSSSGKIVSIDIPSGMEPDSDSPPQTYVKSTVVVTMHAAKPCLKALKKSVDIVIADIGLPLEAEVFAGPGDVLTTIPQRNPLMKKGDGGKVLVIGGSEAYSGAPILTALGSFRSGADLVYLVSPASVAETARSIIPELICSPFSGGRLNSEGVEKAIALLPRVKCLAIGPGLGYNEEIEESVKRIIETATKHSVDVVADADALKCIAELLKKNWRIPANLILTPHPGEFGYLAQKPSNALYERIRGAQSLAKRLKATVLLKGYCDVIASASDTRLSCTGVPAMAVAGTGDVLTGVTACFKSKGLEQFEAAVAAVYTVGVAGSLASKIKGERLIARDIVEHLPDALLDPFGAALKVGVRRLPQEALGGMDWLKLLTTK